MKAFIKTNILLLTMASMHAVWLFLKVNFGNEEYQDNAQKLLLFSTLTGLLLIILPSLKPIFRLLPKQIPTLLKKFEPERHSLLIMLFLTGVISINLIIIPVLRSDLYDEFTFQQAVRILTENGPGFFFAHYGDIPWLGRQHPPLPVLLVGCLVPFGGGNIFFTSRIVTGIIGIATLCCTYLIAAQLYNRRIAFLSMILLLGMRQFYLLNVISGNDIFVTFFFALTVLLLLKLNTLDEKISDRKITKAALAGSALSLGLLSKYTMFLAFLLLPALLIWPFANRFPLIPSSFRIPERIKSGAPVLLITFLFSLPLAGVWLWYLLKTGFFQENTSTFSGYLATDLDFSSGVSATLAESEYFSPWRIRRFLEALVRKIPFSIGLYNLPLIILGLRHWLKREKKRLACWNDRFIAYWIAIVFIPVLFTLPVDRYFLPAYPAVAILMANGITGLGNISMRVLLLAIILGVSSALIYML